MLFVLGGTSDGKKLPMTSLQRRRIRRWHRMQVKMYLGYLISPEPSEKACLEAHLLYHSRRARNG